MVSQPGCRGATLERIARAGGLSKPSLIWHVPSKEAMREALPAGLLDIWLAPFREIDATGGPLRKILGHLRRKLLMRGDYPRESGRPGNEVVQGAARIRPTLEGERTSLVGETAGIIRGWAEDGRIAPVDRHHPMFPIRALTRHHADFDVQPRPVPGRGKGDPFEATGRNRDTLFTRLPPPSAPAKTLTLLQEMLWQGLCARAGMRQDHNGGGLSWSLGKMQIVGPYSVAGIYQDAGVSPVAPAPPIAPVAAAAGGATSGQTRGETGQRGQTPARPAFPTPDPNRPAGPPPAFDTTPLELEAERRQSEASALWRNGARTSQAGEPGERQLDIEV